jgi:hypothetical protein
MAKMYEAIFERTQTFVFAVTGETDEEAEEQAKNWIDQMSEQELENVLSETGDMDLISMEKL